MLFNTGTCRLFNNALINGIIKEGKFYQWDNGKRKKLTDIGFDTVFSGYLEIISGR